MRLPVVIAVGVAAGCLSSSARAQEAVRGPSLGLDAMGSAHALRPLNGIPGAATAGPPLFPDLKLARVFIAPGAEFALAEVASGAPALLLLVPPGATKALPAPTGAHRVVFSRTGCSAALHYVDADRIVIVRGLPSDPVISEIGVSTIPGSIRSLAIRDDGSAVLAGVVEEGRGAVYSVNLEGHVRFLFAAPDPAAVVLLNPESDAVVADWGTNRLIVARGVDGQPILRELGTEDRGSRLGGWLAATRDGRRVVSVSERGEVLILDTPDGSSHSLNCGCRPTGILRLNANAVFRLTTTRGPALIVDAAASPPRIVFVPSPTSAEPGASAGEANPMEYKP